MAKPDYGFDAIVIGAGHNGLAAGAALARWGERASQWSAQADSCFHRKRTQAIS
jgi:tRNA U34 5-carboxymethylaminomethyl modifying enzyme MnmG/GidA